MRAAIEATVMALILAAFLYGFLHSDGVFTMLGNLK
jgi:hypothetical protein